ncbi:MAG: DUF711 family protein [Chloroflexota bacterium]
MAVKVRAITVGTNLGLPFDDAAFSAAAEFCRRAREVVERRGVEVQTLRVAAGKLNPLFGREKSGVVELARSLDLACAEEEIDFCCIGCLDATARRAPAAFAAELSQAVSETERVFVSVLAASKGRGVRGQTALECARTVLRIARATADGFNARRFAVGASVPPNGPFFPTSYHGGGPPAFSLALEAADLVERACADGAGVETACESLVAALEECCLPLEEVARDLEARHGIRYAGIDLSPSPFPAPELSIAGAVESLGGGTFGSSGTLSVIRAIAAALKRVRVKRCGFSGVMLPVLEDSVLLSRVADGKVTLDQLLLFSAVCGTGLDTVPLPGDVSEEHLAAVILDVCGLSLALDKALTARLMPVPGKKAGDWTEFRFPYFGNTRAMALSPDCLRRLLVS